MSQSSSGPPVVETYSPESPPLFEQGINDVVDPNKMDTTQTVTAEQLSSNEFLMNHPAPKCLTEPTLEYYLYFEVLLKEAATLMDKVHKSSSAAQNVRSPTWEKASLQVEDASKRIRAICHYTGIPASHLPTKKELTEMRKAKDLQILQQETEAKIIAETPAIVAETPATTTTQETVIDDSHKPGTATKRKNPAPEDDEGFITVQSRKDKRPTFTSRPVNESRAYSEVLRKANEGKQISHAPQPIIAQEEPLPRANPNRPAPAMTERVVYNSECSLTEILQCLMDLQKDNPSHSHIILQAFGLAKDKMRNSQDKFDMGYHLFAAYTHVLSTSEFRTA
ncbi:hypothetical protein CDAR_432391 [Caerostris darwini]|uniref:Uncharacterized protein n=1 Tax=Caerostris darwini TaxID=1538125 RepID=A0AAV4U2W7_9ARAC|nr:hypothetical protein CDAR_432391 [Caerostris darwini]